MSISMMRSDPHDRGSGKTLVSLAHGKPEWAAGLRQIYDGVVREPLPESVRALLARLDKG